MIALIRRRIEGKTEAAYFNKINAEGGINGRKIRFISYDDSYSPPKTVEQARKLVESDEVLLIFNPLGTASNAAKSGSSGNRVDESNGKCGLKRHGYWVFEVS
jgi:hypothetical protein